MSNLLQETKHEIVLSGHAIADIKFIGSEDEEYACTWAQFEILADMEYDSGYGSAMIATDLIIRFTDGTHMWRIDYDGLEDWAYQLPASKKWRGASKPIYTLGPAMYRSVSAMNANFVRATI